MAAVDLAVLAQRQELQLGSAADMDDLDALTSDLKDFLGKAPDDSAALKHSFRIITFSYSFSIPHAYRPSSPALQVMIVGVVVFSEVQHF